MKRPQNSSLSSLGWLATIVLGLGALVWVVAGLAFSTESNQYDASTETLATLIGWMGVGGTLVGFGMFALVGYLMIAAVGEYLAPLLPGVYDSGHHERNSAIDRFVRNGVDADPDADGADRG